MDECNCASVRIWGHTRICVPGTPPTLSPMVSGCLAVDGAEPSNHDLALASPLGPGLSPIIRQLRLKYAHLRLVCHRSRALAPLLVSACGAWPKSICRRCCAQLDPINWSSRVRIATRVVANTMYYITYRRSNIVLHG